MRKLLVSLTLAAATLVPAWGQRFEISAIRGFARMDKAPLGSSNAEYPDDEDTKFRNGSSTGIRFTINSKGYYGHEIGYLLTKVKVRNNVLQDDGTKVASEGKAYIHQYFYSFLAYFMPRDERVRPYFAVGFQTHRHSTPKVDGWAGHPTRNLGMHYGLGIKLRLFQHTLVRADLRDYLTGKPYDLYYEEMSDEVGGFTRQQEASVGFAITF